MSTRWRKWQGLVIDKWLNWPCQIIRETPKKSLEIACGLRQPVQILKNNIHQPEYDGYITSIEVFNGEVLIVVLPINSQNGSKNLQKIILGPNDSINSPQLAA